MTKTQSSFVETNGINIHYERLGDGKQPFLLCHGITDNGCCMLRLGEYLANRFDVILVDARGHGQSDKPEEGYSSDHHADDLYGLIQALDLEKPIIYGHSMGARTTIRLAAKYPDMPKAVIIEDPVYIIPMTVADLEAGRAWAEGMPDEIRRWKTLSEAERLQMAEEAGHPDWRDVDKLEWAKSRVQVSTNVFKMGGSMANIPDDFPLITCPVLVLKADADEEIRHKNETSIAKIPQGKILHIKGAGHNVRRDNWAETIRNLDEFLTTI